MVVENGQLKESERQSDTSISSRKQSYWANDYKGFSMLENTHTPSFSFFILGAIVPYASATLETPHRERKELRIEAKQWSVVMPNIHYAQKQLTYPRDSIRGFKLVMKGPK